MWKIVERCHRIEVNERGEIRYRDTGKMASTSVNAVGYIQVGVWVGNKVRTFNVHRLVAEAFIPNPDNLPQINHKDENRANCNVSNLEWCSAKYNCNYGTHIEKLRKNCCKPVVATNKKTGEETHFYSTAEASRQLGCSPNVITRCLCGLRKTAQGYYWKFAEGAV